jgi:hypothetical protein
MYNDSIVQAASARLNSTIRWHGAYGAKADVARNALVVARLERAIQEALHPTEEGFKKLPKKDRERLARMLTHG